MEEKWNCSGLGGRWSQPLAPPSPLEVVPAAVPHGSRAQPWRVESLSSRSFKLDLVISEDPVQRKERGSGVNSQGQICA